jgi:hypothetical protein
MNECTYLFHGEEGGGSGEFLANTDLVCPAGKASSSTLKARPAAP